MNKMIKRKAIELRERKMEFVKKYLTSSNIGDKRKLSIL